MFRTLSVTLLFTCLLVGSHAHSHWSPFKENVDNALPKLVKASKEENAGHDCIHDQLAREMDEARRPMVRQQYGVPGPTLALNEVGQHRHDNHEESERQHILQTATWGPLRIKIVSRLDNDQGRTCYTVGETITVGTPASGTKCSDTISRNCENVCTQEQVLTTEKRKYILERVVPDALEKLKVSLKTRSVTGDLTLSGRQCGVSSITAVLPTEAELTHSDTDMAIFLTARPTFGSTIAYALSCDADTLGRPISGQFNWGPNQVDTTAYPKQLGVALHELTHALGFSSSYYGRFIDQATLATRNAVLSTTLDRKESGSAISVVQLITPNVVSRVRSHFGCNSATGGNLEDQGGGGTGGSHWEKRLYLNEYMTGSASSEPVFSEITLALFKDMGWYEPDFSQAAPLSFGQSKGCPFLTGCWNKEPDHYCNDASLEKCTFDRRAKGFCGISEYGATLPSTYQPFPSQPNIGGIDQLADYCPYFVGYSNGRCTDENNQKENDPLGQVFNSRSRCMTSSLTDNQFNSDGGTRMACYPIACVRSSSDGSIRVKIQVGKYWIDCPQASGAKIQAVGFSGDLTCPDPVDLCKTETIEENWPIINATAPVLPNRGRESGGTRITISGENFDEDASYQVLIGDRRCRAVRWKSRSRLQCVTSRKKLGILEDAVSFDVIISDETGRSVIAVNGYTYTSRATALSMSAVVSLAIALFALVLA